VVAAEKPQAERVAARVRVIAFATFLVGWQAFVNYYYFIGALLILASLVRARADDRV
jgi:hypothetical protein